MAAEEFHKEFWVAIATAAPVIGLASAVTADQLVRRFERVADRVEKQGQIPPPLRLGTFWIAYANIIAQAFALTAALSFLNVKVDLLGLRWGAIVFEGAGLLMVFIPTAFALDREGRRRRMASEAPSSPG